jgi:hypothetical protein
MFKGVLAIFLFFAFGANVAIGQVEPPVQQSPPDGTARLERVLPKRQRDSATLARQKFVTDSIMRHTWMLPDSLLDRYMIIDSILKANVRVLKKGEAWYNLPGKGKAESFYKIGRPVPKGEPWVLGFILFLLLLFGILRISFHKQLGDIIQAFYSNRVLNNLYKEDNLFTSWPFLFLFIQFGFTLGMFLYLISQYYQVSYGAGGLQFFVTISVMIVILYALKIFVLRGLGHLFNIQKLVHEYITVLYLSYFNISLIFIPLVVAFALAPLRYGMYFISAAAMLLGVIFLFQFIRAGYNILSNNRFSKVYLFLYFCALEICPILIVIKAIGL